MRLNGSLRGKEVGMYMYSTQYVVGRIAMYIIDNELCRKKNPSANNVNVKRNKVYVGKESGAS